MSIKVHFSAAPYRKTTPPIVCPIVFITEECWTLRLQDISPTTWDTSPTGQFAYETFRLLDTSPTPWTVRPLNVNNGGFRLPTDFYRATSAVLGIVIRSAGPSVCPSAVCVSHVCFVTNPKNLQAIFLAQP